MKLNIKKTIKRLLLILVFVLPFNFRYILNFTDTQNLNFFSENLKYSLYLFDILFLIIFFCWLPQKLKTKNFFKTNWPLFLLAFYLLWNSLVVSANPIPSLYNSLRLLEVLIFFLIFIDTAKTKDFFQKTIYLIFLSGVIQSIIALLQFIFQKSLHLKYLGESVLSPQILGVAKLEVQGEKFIRGYGTLPHPNLLGAFLLLSLIAGLYFALNKNFKIPFSIPVKFKKLKLKTADKTKIKKVHFIEGLVLILGGILITFSRSIWLMTALLGLYLTIKYFWANRPNLKRLFQKKYIFPVLILLAILLIGFYKFIPARLCPGNCQDQSLTLRNQYADFSKKEILHNNYWTGIGAGQFPVIFNTLNPQNLPKYHIQPVHNFYLLAWSEIGLLGIILIIFFLTRNISKKIIFRNKLFALLITDFLLLGFFDHYFWSLPQGQFIFWLALALLIISSRINE